MQILPGELAEAKILLTFEETYSPGTRNYSPDQALQIYANDSQVFEFDRRTRLKASKNAARAIHFTHGFVDQNLSPVYNRILNMYSEYTAILGFIETNIQNETELGQLLQQNPYVIDILSYLSTGNSFKTYLVEDFNNRLYSISMHKLFVEGEWDKTNLAWLAQASLFKNYLKGETNMGNRLQVTIGRVLAHKESFSNADPRCEFASHVRRFLNCGFLIEYHQSQGRENERRLMQFLENPKDVETVNLVEYYRDSFMKFGIPYGLKVLMQAQIQSNQSELKDYIENTIHYSRGAIKNFMLKGFRFLENELLLDTPNHSLQPPIEYYMTNRREQVARILELIAEEY
jgi:hypothetical protein